MVSQEQELVSQPDQADQEPEAEAARYINATVKLLVEDYARLQKMAHLAFLWGLIKRDSFAEFMRWGLNLAGGHVHQAYLQKKEGR